MTPIQDDFPRVLQSSLEEIYADRESIASIIEKHPALAELLRADLETALWFQRQRDLFDAQPGFLNDSRNRLVSRIQHLGKARVTSISFSRINRFIPVGRRKLIFRLILILTLMLIVFISGSRIAFLSNRSLPGDALYAIKTALESATLLVSASPVAKARIHIQYSHRRLVELQSLVLKERFEEIPATVADFEIHVEQAVRALYLARETFPTQAPVLATSLAKMLSDQAPMLVTLLAVVPPEIKPELGRAQSASDVGITSAAEILSTGNTTLIWTLIPSPSTTFSPNLAPSLVSFTTTAPFSTTSPFPEGVSTPISTSPNAPTSVKSPSWTPTPVGLSTDTWQSATPTLKPDKKPSKTPRPTKTPKPHPNPRRHPKP